MSQHLISLYLNELADLRRVSGRSNESIVREAFKTLLKNWGRSKDLILVPEYPFETPRRERRQIDGALVPSELRVPYGYWEAKDEEDDLDAEIERKFRRGYPQDNIVFEDSRHAVLIQNRREIMRCPVDDPPRLARLLELFFSYERPEIAEFRKAVAQFKTDLPAVLEALRAIIESAEAANPQFRSASLTFLRHAQETINPSVTAADVREMLIQHILTEEIFSHVFDNADFHRQNNVARELYRLAETFFTGAVRRQTLERLRAYYAAIRSAAALVSSHHEKQNFLKVVYENFYKVYNPKAADRLGVVYTPNEIVRFMIEGADFLCQRHFGKQLIDRDVEILDPAAGTGTFIAELIEHFRGQPAKLKHKYKEELHANEVAILPYYVANLNIEATYAALTGEYEEYPNLCFVDTLDNVAGLRTHRAGTGHFGDLLGALSDENVARIRRQNERKISVIIGNPPYNANQLNENENNKNRPYPAIDKRIKETYIAASTAQKTKLYDMYARFFRWASDRIDENGVIAFVSNSSFIDSRTYDGFRKVISKEFNEVWIVDLKGNARTSGERRRQEGGNIFSNQIRVGIAIYFCIRKRGLKDCRIRYEATRYYAKADEKIDFLTSTLISERKFQEIQADAKNNWINHTDNDFNSLIPLGSKETKAARRRTEEATVFKLFSNGVNTARDEWVYDFDEEQLAQKIRFMVKLYNLEHVRVRALGKVDRDNLDKSIKWSAGLIGSLLTKSASFSHKRIVHALYRPFVDVRYYADDVFSDRITGNHSAIFGFDFRDVRLCIALSASGSSKTFSCLAVTRLADWHFLGDTQLFPLLRRENNRLVPNITDWAERKFCDRYEDGAVGKREITKNAIFHYVYGVLHDPAFREKYALNLKREFPRIPLYDNFWRWAEWGERLMALHIGYESVKKWPLQRIDVPDETARWAKRAPKTILRADRSAGGIVLDSETQLAGIPESAWEYRLGNRSALEWVLDQHKEKKPKDPTIRERFNTYRFADHKERVIDLLRRVTRVSVETVAIVGAMRDVTGST